MFMGFGGLLIMCLTIIKSEKNPETILEVSNIWEQYKLTKGIVLNKHLRDLSIITLI
jgi:hypothetical protein